MFNLFSFLIENKVRFNKFITTIYYIEIYSIYTEVDNYLHE